MSAGSRRERVVALMREGQRRIVAALEALEERQPPGGDGIAGGAADEAGIAGARFRAHDWQRPGGGGGSARVLEGGRLFERAGVNVSAVHGDAVPPTLAAQHPGTEGKPFFATGLSMVFHPRNPFVPAFHANYRYFEVGHGERSGVWWFGGGADMTPCYPREADVRHFHRTLAELCGRHPQADYARFKRTCDDYFRIRHRDEMRGVGGIFFDELSAPDARLDDADRFERDLAFVEDGVASLLPSYEPIVERRRNTPYGERERRWQLVRRGRYAEFNLVYDRGTLFGLQTRGNIEAILMSMPPLAGWRFDHTPEPGSPEAEALRFFQPRDWLAEPSAAGGER